MNETAAITHFFNFENDSNKAKSFIKFKEKLESQGVPLFVVEVVPEGGSPELKSSHEKEHYHLERILFPLLIEGNSLNVLCSKIPEHYKKIVWFDDKFLISENNWLNKCSKLLEKYKLIRINKNLKHKSPCMVDREFFERVGVFDFDFCGTSSLITYSCLADTDLFSEGNTLMNLYKKNNLDIYYKILSHKQDCDSYFKKNIKGLTLKTESVYRDSEKPEKEFIKLLKEIDVEYNISYKGLNKIISLKNAREIKYSDNLLKLLK